ncbi:restriction endonuclease subunit S, partial [Campylobacter upsaliensis]
MKTDTLKKSLLDYAIKGSLTAKFRRENTGLNAFNELEIYNEAIKEKRKNLEKELKKCEKEFKLEKDKDKKALFKSQIQMRKKELTKCKEITPLNLSEAPFEIPNTWAWVKLGDICEMKKGPFGSAITKDMFIPNGSNAVKIYEQKNAIQKSETLGEYYISLEHFEKLKQFEVFENDIIVSCAGTIGEIFRIPKNAPKGIINQALMKIKLVNEEWIPYFMIFFDFLIKQKSQENSKGSAIKNIPPLD